MNFPNMLVIGALIATAVALALGLRSMRIGGEYDQTHAEKYMWERVGLQALVIVMLVIAVLMGKP